MFTAADLQSIPHNAVIGITGSRRGGSPLQLALLRAILNMIDVTKASLHHGDCIGFDAQAHEEAMLRNIPIIIHPPLISKNRAWCEGAVKIMSEEAYRIRNRAIVNACSVLVAAPYTNSFRSKDQSGTWMTIHYAQKAGKPVCQLFRERSIV